MGYMGYMGYMEYGIMELGGGMRAHGGAEVQRYGGAEVWGYGNTGMHGVQGHGGTEHGGMKGVCGCMGYFWYCVVWSQSVNAATVCFYDCVRICVFGGVPRKARAQYLSNSGLPDSFAVGDI